MLEEPKKIVVIPARGGSKRIPFKNIALFNDQPAISITINTLFASSLFDKVIVSTDDDQIAQISSQSGADVIRRSRELSDDNTPILPVIQDVIKSFDFLEVVGMVLPTSVLLDANTLKTSYQYLVEDPSLDYVIGIKRFECSPARALRMNSRELISIANPEEINKRSQDLETMYFDAGQFSIGRPEAWKSGSHSFTAKTRGVVIPPWQAVDIDNPDDLELARLLYKATYKYE